MKRKRILAIALGCSVLFTGCTSHLAEEFFQALSDNGSQNNNHNSQNENHIQQQAGGQESTENQVIMVYMVGSDLETDAGLGSEDIAEIAVSGFDEANTEVLICTGGAREWWIDEIPNDECTVFEVTGGKIHPVYTLNNKNMAEPQTLTEFINYAYINHEADYYDLVLWNHGGGAILGYGADENYDYDALTIAEMDQALRGTKLVAEGNRFEWIGFDACLMAMLEVADMMSDYADYLIASEEVEAGTGWDYTCLKRLSDGKHFDGAAAAEGIISAYGEYYEENYRYIPDYTLSCLELSQTGEVVNALEELVTTAGEELQSGGYSKIARQRDRTKTFGIVSESSFYDTVDLYDLTVNLMDLYPEEASNLQSALDKMVVCEETNIIGAHGVAVYFPYDNKEYAGEWLGEYNDMGFSETYLKFISSFTAGLSGEQIAEWDVENIETEESTTEAGKYYVQLTEEQVENFSRASFEAWQEVPQRGFVRWTSSTDVHLSEDGVLSASFDERRFYLVDGLGREYACCAMELERGDDYVKYCIPILVERQVAEVSSEDPIGDWDYYSAYIHVKVDEENPTGVITGIYQSADADSTIFPDKDTMELLEGDSIMTVIHAREIEFNEDGSVKPFEEWANLNHTEKYFTLEGDLNITMKEVAEGAEYCGFFTIKDTQGNYYYTNPVYIQY